jgi:hypothetical protein
MNETTSIHLYDSKNGEVSVTVYSNTIPRVGDEVYYWLDMPSVYPKHLQLPEENTPKRISGTVSNVGIEYRVMRGWSKTSPDKIVTMVSVELDDYKATLWDLSKIILEK